MLGFRPVTKDSVLAFVEGDGESPPVIPNWYSVETAERLNSPIPGNVLPPGDGAFATVVLAEIVAHIVGSNAASAELPFSTRIGNVPAPPSATSLLVTLTSDVPL